MDGVLPELMPRRVLIIEDHHDLAVALAMAFDGDPGYQVCAVAHDIPEALDLMPGANADLVTVDINLPGGSGLELIPALRRMNPSARFLVLSQEDPARFAPLARAAGAAGYLRKGASLATILQVASAVLAGDECFPEPTHRRQT